MSKKNPPSDDEIALFRKMMKDVTPLKERKKAAHPESTPPHTKKQHTPLPRPVPRAVSDGIDFSIAPDEVIAYFANGFPKDMRKKLIKGLIPVESRLDLHQMNREQAHVALDSFIQSHSQKGIRCCNVMHGKGKGVLKNLVARWLSQYDEVLAYHSCLPKHGGTGALYVYLRRYY